MIYLLIFVSSLWIHFFPLLSQVSGAASCHQRHKSTYTVSGSWCKHMGKMKKKQWSSGVRGFNRKFFTSGAQSTHSHYVYLPNSESDCFTPHVLMSTSVILSHLCALWCHQEAAGHCVSSPPNCLFLCSCFLSFILNPSILHPHTPDHSEYGCLWHADISVG